VLVGLIGHAGAGKTTTAKHLQNTHAFMRLSYSAPLKEVVSMLFDIPLAHLHDTKKKEQVISRWRMSARSILQIFGTECMRHHFGNDFWTKKMQRTIHKLHYLSLVIDDVRFKSEATQVLNQGGYLIHVQRPNNPYRTDTGHISEQLEALQVSADIPVIQNNGTINELGVKITELFNRIKERELNVSELSEQTRRNDNGKIL